MGAQPMPFPSDHPTNRLDHDPRTALHGPAYEWPLWSTTMRVVTADPHALPSARRLVETELAHVELAASRERRDAEVVDAAHGPADADQRHPHRDPRGRPPRGRDTDGALDPTVGRALRPVGDADPGAASSWTSGTRPSSSPAASSWTSTPSPGPGPPTGVRPWSPDVLDVGVLVSLGGDIATAGSGRAAAPGRSSSARHPDDQPSAPGGPRRHPDRPGRGHLDLDDDRDHPLPNRHRGRPGLRHRHHLVGGRPRRPRVWPRLTERGLPARLVGADGSLTYLGGWPEDGEMAPTTRAGC